ncbi:hypothetical protein Taro_034821 [Colocasia esculenta]|uniref:1-phosphatidylinositol-4-phosphate 5-kinase n=1 Tax=Colocasia esculenta TaxID=4460 RepID=A0A843VSJ6_COLES|nr:hypothetical protein [Colocasia esculenta]
MGLNKGGSVREWAGVGIAGSGQGGLGGWLDVGECHREHRGDCGGVRYGWEALGAREGRGVCRKGWRPAPPRAATINRSFAQVGSSNYRRELRLALVECLRRSPATLGGDGGDMPFNADAAVPSKGLLLVAHEPGSSAATRGSHIRGSAPRASAIGDQEVDLLLPDAGRLRVQLGVNMPAQAYCKRQCNECPASTGVNLTVCDVVLYFGIIDILQDYNMKKKIEHVLKSLRFDPMTISAVEPKLYAKRFVSFLEKVFPVQE